MVIDGYVRVSQVGGRGGQSFISPVVQREQIEAWAVANGSLIAQVFEELDESGARADRPLLAAAIERVEHGETQGIVVAKLDRFGRSLVDGLSKIDRIAAAGGIFVSVQDGLDLSTPTGKLVLRIMFSMAEWELDLRPVSWQLHMPEVGTTAAAVERVSEIEREHRSSMLMRDRRARLRDQLAVDDLR